VVFAWWQGWIAKDFVPAAFKIVQTVNNLSQPAVNQEVLAPPPLRAAKSSQQSWLTIQGIINETNKQRLANGLPALAVNLKLNQAASLKTQDMFLKQYFEHVSPSGAGVGELAKTASYQFIVVGENLALGNFANDQELVEAWMQSPGHRANILNKRFTEIGVAAQKGIFEGQETWLAVQEFGLPLSACSQPNSALLDQLNNQQAQINSLQTKLNSLKAELEQGRFKNRGDYNNKVQDFNVLLEQYNQLVQQTKTSTDFYNQQVNNFNNCVKGTN
jgi:uncharacterized protein YkwD